MICFRSRRSWQVVYRWQNGRGDACEDAVSIPAVLRKGKRGHGAQTQPTGRHYQSLWNVDVRCGYGRIFSMNRSRRLRRFRMTSTLMVKPDGDKPGGRRASRWSRLKARAATTRRSWRRTLVMSDGRRHPRRAVKMARLDAAPGYGRAKVLVKRAKETLPDRKTEAVSEWMGHRPALPDTVPSSGLRQNARTSLKPQVTAIYPTLRFFVPDPINSTDSGGAARF